MTELPPEDSSPEDSSPYDISPDGVDERYRQASSREISRPSDSVRRAVLQHATDLAAQRAAAKRPVGIDLRQRAANQAWRRPVAYGGLAAAVIAGLLIAPRFLTTPSPTQEIAAAGPPGRAMGPPRRTPAMDSGAAPTTAPAPAPATAPATDSAPAHIAPPAPVAPASSPIQSSARQAKSAAPFASFSAEVPRPIDSASALRQSAAVGDLTRLRALLAEEPDIDSRDPAGRSALMLAVLDGQADAVDLLLASGADANAADAQGTTPLQAALARHRSAIARALRRAGAR